MCSSEALTAVPPSTVHYNDTLVEGTECMHAVQCMHKQDHASGTALRHSMQCSSTPGLQEVSGPGLADVQGPTSTS